MNKNRSNTDSDTESLLSSATNSNETLIENAENNSDDDDEPFKPEKAESHGSHDNNENVLTNSNSEVLADSTLRRRIVFDSVYESLDYEICENVLWKNDQKNVAQKFTFRKETARWVVFLFIGIETAIIASIIDIAIEELSALKYGLLKNLVDYNIVEGNLYVPYLFWILTSIVPVAIGSALVTYFEPIAAGSGVSEVKCYLNGVNIPRIVDIKTLLVKAVGVITSIVGGLAGGKEEPMIHVGAVVAAGISQGKSTTFNRDFKIFKYFRDDHEKHDFVLGGASAGIAAAFGAPIGGVLFSLEEAAGFWNQMLIWRILVASVVSSFTLNVVLSAYRYHGLEELTFPGLFNLDKLHEVPYEYFELPIFVLIGISGGMSGALWNYLNTKLLLLRKRSIKNKFIKILEIVLISIIGVTIACLMIYLINDCRAVENISTNYQVQMFCEDDQYNAVASLWLQTPTDSIKSLFHDPADSQKIVTLVVFHIAYYFLSCFTFGLNVSLGIFIPQVLIGAVRGRLIAMILFAVHPKATFLIPGKYALIGAAAQLGGVLRMTISLSVILIEMTGVDTSFAFPLIITLISAKWMGDYFNEGVYDSHIKINHVPMLPWQLPESFQGLKSEKIMSHPVICVKLREQVNYLFHILNTCKHNGFPIVEDVEGDNRSNGKICGLILRSQLIVIIKKSLYYEKKKFWEKEISIETFRNEYPRFPSERTLRMHRDNTDCTIDFGIFMNPSPVQVSKSDSVPRIFQTFRALGLRHMVVTNENRVVGIITRKDFIR